MALRLEEQLWNAAQPLRIRPGRRRVTDLLTMWAPVVAVAAAALSAFAAAGAALFTWHYARTTSRAATTATVSRLLDTYSRRETYDAMEALADFRTRNGPNFATLYGQRVRDHDETIAEVKRCRRQLKYFFQEIRALCELHLVDEATLAGTFSLTPFRFYCDVIEPMNREDTAHMMDGEQHDRRTYDFFLKFLETHAGGKP